MSDELLAAIHEELLSQGKTLSALDTKVTNLVGNGIRDGRIGVLETDVDDLKAAKNRMYGANAAVAALVGSWEVLKHYLKIV